MQTYIHKLTISVMTLDPNPASVATTIDGALTNYHTQHPKGRILTTDTQPHIDATEEATIPDEPTRESGRAILGRPYFAGEMMRATDTWWNDFVLEAFAKATGLRD